MLLRKIIHNKVFKDLIRLKRKGITLISRGQFEKDFIEQMALDIERVFGIQVNIAPFYHDIAACFDAARKQYDANQLLEMVHAEHAESSLKTIGLFKVDLFIPILTYIFGQAQYKGPVGITSVYRLRNEQYGLPQNEQLLYERFRKVIIHELGHTFGLIHCHVPICVMRPGAYVEDIDQKKHLFCNKCKKELEQVI